MITSSGITQTLSLTPNNAFISGTIVPFNLEFSQWDLYLHFSYLKSLFDFNSTIKKIETNSFTIKIIEKLRENQEEMEKLKKCQSIMDSVLEKCGYHYVNLSSLFSLLK